MTEPKVVNAFRDYTHNGTMPSERRSILIGVCDHIDRLAARVQELEEKNQRLRDTFGASLNLLADERASLNLLADERDDARAENTRLRKALEGANKARSDALNNNAQLHERVQELEERHEDSEYRNVHLEKVVDDQQAEITRLREALERIEAVRRTNKWPDKVVVKEMEHISRSALKEKP